jgi:uncharacterized membrane protein
MDINELNRAKNGKQFRRKFLKTFLDLHRVTLPIWGSLVLLVVLLGVVFSFVEKIRVFEGIYFSFITALTIGFGDISPSTRLGMILSVFIGIIGMVATGIIVALAIQAVRISYESVHGKDLKITGEPENKGTEERNS